jgi:uncharacterized protein YydD (DUF2326 family)
VIRGISANHASFHSVTFTPGFNVVLADRTNEATKTDSRNALGKSTLISIIDFCLGAQVKAGDGIRSVALEGWAFSLDLSVDNHDFTVTREVDDSSFVRLTGDVPPLPAGVRADEARGMYLRLKEWTDSLGWIFFGLQPEEGQYKPTFRAILPYFMRWGRAAFASAFEHRPGQQTWQTQLYVSFLLGLEWQFARERQQLRARKKQLDALKPVVQGDSINNVLGDVAELEAEVVRLDRMIDRQRESLASFNVLPQYRELESEANALTNVIHDLTNDNMLDRRLIQLYGSRMADESELDPAEVGRMYVEAGTLFPEQTLRRLEEVHAFHRQVADNRQRFLIAETARLGSAVQAREGEMAAAVEQRSSIMTLLSRSRALDEHVAMQERLGVAVARRESAASRLETLLNLRNAGAKLKVEENILYQQSLAAFEERRDEWRRIVSRFGEFTDVLYGREGQLLIDVTESGYKFGIEMRNIDSQGVGNMAVFCFDLALASEWSRRSPNPGFLVHDSTIFDGVDERQIARALELANRVSLEDGFQYICTLNSDLVPWTEFTSPFDLQQHVRLRLTDSTEEGRLLGVRY